MTKQKVLQALTLMQIAILLLMTLKVNEKPKAL